LTSTLAFWTAHFCVHTCKLIKKKIDSQFAENSVNEPHGEMLICPLGHTL
jgi:hypothetical protein